MRKQQLVVIGNGMAGARLVEDLIKRGGRELFDIKVFGDEPCGNYNRILLSGVLSRSHEPDDIFINPLSWYAANGISLQVGARVGHIDLQRRIVSTNAGEMAEYDELVIATGSSPVVPPIARVRNCDGVLREGVFVFRTLEDCRHIMRAAEKARRAVVVGGGLLGLEAARGLINWGLETHVVHLMPHLMETQIDTAAAGVLLAQLEKLGLRTHLATRTTAVAGDGTVTGLEFADGSRLDCDLVVIAAGIRPNVALAANAGLKVGRGIIVGDDLRCQIAATDSSAAPVANVHAVGECAEHRGTVYGLVAPLWEQTAVLADRLSRRRPEALFEGSRVSTKLKVMGVDLAVMGDKDAGDERDEVVSYSEPARGVYKKLIVRNNRLAGAIILGDPALAPTLLQTFAAGLPITANRAELLFAAYGGTAAAHPTQLPSASTEALPDDARVCDCNNVSKAQIVEAVLQGARSVRAVSETTRATTGCGSCRPEVEAIVGLACQGLQTPAIVGAEFEVLQSNTNAQVSNRDPNKIERLKREKDALDVAADVPRFVEEGWERISDSDRERLKWLGVFFRRQTPGRFMMRIRMPNGFTSSEQLQAIAELSRDRGTGFVDITTRQQIQLRGFRIGDLTTIWGRLNAVGLGSLQTGMDNIRNVIGCPVAGLTTHELFDASPIVREFTAAFLNNRAFTNLPRKFNAAISACTANCIHAETQDLALTAAVRDVDGRETKGFNVAVGGKVGSGGLRIASPLDVFVTVEHAASLCGHLTLLFRDHGPRGARNRARLAFLIDAWGVKRVREELERRVGHRLLQAGHDVRVSAHVDHLGIVRQKQPGLYSVGLNVPVGRVTADQLFEVARVAELYGSGDVRVTTGQNFILTDVRESRLPELLAEPILQELRHDPSPITRGLVSCTGIDYCHMALIETKELALKTARELEGRLPHMKGALTMHWSGCPAGCGNHTTADIGLLGKNVRIGHEVVDAVDVFVGGCAGPKAVPGTKLLEDVPCRDLPVVLERIVPYLSGKRGPKRPDGVVSQLAYASR